MTPPSRPPSSASAPLHPTAIRTASRVSAPHPAASARWPHRRLRAPSAGRRAARRYTTRSAVGPANRMRCVTPAGTHTPQLDGTTHDPLPRPHHRRPNRTWMNWCQPCACSSMRPAEIGGRAADHQIRLVGDAATVLRHHSPNSAIASPPARRYHRPMPNNLASFAIHVDDVDRARRFYQAVFGWNFEPWGPPGLLPHPHRHAGTSPASPADARPG